MFRNPKENHPPTSKFIEKIIKNNPPNTFKNVDIQRGQSSILGGENSKDVIELTRKDGSILTGEVYLTDSPASEPKSPPPSQDYQD